MHIAIWPLLRILIVAALLCWANRMLITPGRLQNIIYVVIVVVAVLFALVSLGLIGSSGISVSGH